MLDRSAAEAGFAEFATATQQSMFRQAYLLTGTREAAQDLVQTTLLKMYAAWRRPGRIENPRGYAHRTMIRAYLDGRRRDQHQLRLATLPDPPGAAPSPVDRMTVLGALGQLPPRMRAVIVLRFWEDLSVEDTAHALGCSTGTVKSTTAKGLERLRSILGATFEIAGAEL